MKSVKANLLINIILCFVIVLSFVINGEATTNDYYMATNGSDNNTCSIVSPCATLGHIQGKVTAGDTVHIRAGTYSSHKVAWTKSGLPGNPITIKAYSGETPKFDGNQRNQLILLTATPIVHDVVIDGLEVYDYKFGAFTIWNSNNITIKNCFIHDILAHESGAISAGSNTGSDIVYNIIIEDNTFENNGGNLCDSLNHSLYFTGGVHSSTIRNNKFTETSSCVQFQVQIYHSGSNANHDNTIYNNIFYMKTGTSVSSNLYIQGSTHDVYNNTFFNDCTGANSNKCMFIRDWGNSSMKNNIFYAVNPQPDLLTGRENRSGIDNNLWYPSKDPDDSGSSSIVGNPLFKDKATKDFRLTLGSAAIGAGDNTICPPTDIDGQGRPTEGICAIGAYAGWPVVQTYQCSDGIDNDNDGFIDMDDEGCGSASDNDEANAATPSDDYDYIVKVDPEGTYIDAENATGTITQGISAFLLENTLSDYVGTGYLAASGTAANSCSSVNEGKEYQVNVEDTGTYNIWIRGYGMDGSSDSIFVGVDGACVGALNQNSIHNQWVWTNNLQSGTGVNTLDIISPGIHTVNIWIREPNFLVDVIYLTKGTETPPNNIELLNSIPPSSPFEIEFN